MGIKLSLICGKSLVVTLDFKRSWLSQLQIEFHQKSYYIAEKCSAIFSGSYNYVCFNLVTVRFQYQKAFSNKQSQVHKHRNEPVPATNLYQTCTNCKWCMGYWWTAGGAIAVNQSFIPGIGNINIILSYLQLIVFSLLCQSFFMYTLQYLQKILSRMTQM